MDSARVSFPPVAHESAHKHVSGEAVYIDDIMPLQGQLHAYVGGSAIAHGRIVRCDLDDVLKAPGVVDVITARDIPAQADIGPVFPGDPLLAEETVEYVGQPIFAILAESHNAARRAVKRANIEYLPQSPVLDIEQAIHEAFYVRPPYTMARGEADKALQQAPVRLSGSISVGGQEHFYLEGQVALAVPREDRGLSVYSSTQNPTEIQEIVAEVLGISMNDVNVETRRMGGGFGGKETQAAAWACIAAIFASRNNRPVACRLSRREDMTMTGKRHDFKNSYDVGVDAQGCLLAAEYVLAARCGNSPDLSDAIVDRAMLHCDNAYYIPHVRIKGLRCKSHTVSNTAFRGFGGPQGMMAVETVMDHIAYATRQHPLTVRKKNLYDTSGRNLTPYFQEIDVFNIPQIIERLERSSAYWQREADIRKFNRNSAVLKRGIALTPVKFGISFNVPHLNQAGALLHIYKDGSVHLNHGGTEMGQGLLTKVRQIVAECLGVSRHRVSVTATRTDKVPNTSATAASAGTDLNGMAAWDAARRLKARIGEMICDVYGAQKQEIIFENEQVRFAGQAKPFAEIAREAWMKRVSLSATGYYKTPKIHYDRPQARGRPFLYFANGAAVSEVIIDTLTGEFRLLRADILHDVGNSINPAIDIGQIEGGYVQGVGWLTCEELKWHADGRLLTDSPATYKIPAVTDAPPVFNVQLLENAPNSEPTIFRSKAVGEPPLMLAISAWCAIRHAIGSLADYRVFPQLRAPATPEEILRCVDRTNASQ